ncbi:predicted protein, partial [Nematostella vectensis]
MMDNFANATHGTPTSPKSSLSELSIVALASVMVLSVFGNSLVLVAFKRYRRLRTVTNYFLVSLAAADLLVSMLTMPCWLTIRVLEISEAPRGNPNHVVPYYIWQYVEILGSTASITSLCVIGYDRHLAISAPLTYHARMTSRRALVAITCCWVYAACCAALSFVNISPSIQPTSGIFYAWFISLAAFFMPLVIILSFYCRIFIIAVGQAKKLSKEPYVYGTEKERRSVFRRELKITKTLAVVIGAFVVCWAPFFTIIIRFALCSPHCTTDPALISVSKWLHYCSTFINPIIYTLLTRGFRRAFTRVLWCRCGR